MVGCVFFKQKAAYEIRLGLVGSEMCIKDGKPTLQFLRSLADLGLIKIVEVKDGAVPGGSRVETSN